MRRFVLLFCFVSPIVWSFQRPKLMSIKPISRRFYPLLPAKSLDNHPNERQRQISNEDLDVCIDHRYYDDDTMIMMIGSCLSLSILLFMPMLTQAVDITIPSGTISSIDAPLPIAAVDFQAIIAKATSRAVDGGTAGASAAAIQVLSLMWLRTAMNYQYRYGTSTSQALSALYQEGGIPRLYKGLPFALVQGPMSRFGDTAANALVLSLVDSLDLVYGATTPIFLRTALASCGAAIWRIILLPVDTAKTCLQVDGSLIVLRDRLAKEGPSALFNGAIANSLATLIGHYPWFLTYNYLSEGGDASGFLAMISPIYAMLALVDPRVLTLLRSAFIGLCASSLSDTCSNSMRVLKTSRQTAGAGSVTSLPELAKSIILKDGWQGLFGRGLQTRLLVNALQGMLFSVLFKYFQSSSGK